MAKETLDDLQNGFFIYQDTENFRFGIDAVLLADFVRIKKGDTVCDLGCGTGIIPLLLSARHKGLKVTGLEINERSADLAEKSVIYNGLSDTVRIVRGDIRKAGELFDRQSFKVVVTNPPYRKAGSGEINPDSGKAAARHEILVNLSQVLQAADFLLASSGRLYMVHRPERLAEITAGCMENHLAVKKMAFVHPKAGKPASMVLIEAVKGAQEGMHVLPPVIVYDEEGNYTDTVKQIYDKA